MNRLLDERLRQDASEQRVGRGVSPPHPPGLPINAVQPFEAQPLNPIRCAPNGACKNIERATHTHDERYAEIVTMSGEKALLPWCRHADEETIGRAGLDVPNDVILLLGFEVAVVPAREDQ